MRHLHGLATCPAMPLPTCRVLTVSAGGTAAAAEQGQPQHGSGDWLIAAVHTGNRASLASHRSSGLDTVEDTLSPRFAGAGGTAAATQQRDLQQEVPSAADVLRLPSQDLMGADVNADVSSLFEGRISALIDLQPGVDGAADDVPPAAPAAAAEASTGMQAALGRAESAADVLPTAFAAAVEGSTGMQAAPWPASPPPARPSTAPGSWPARRSGLRYNSCNISSGGGYEHLRLDSPKAHVSCMSWRRARKGAHTQPHVDACASKELEPRASGPSADDACGLQQQQVMLVWLLREELAAAELQLLRLQQQQAQHRTAGAGHSKGGALPSSRRLRAVTMDSAVTRSAALGSSGASAAAKARHTTVDGALHREHTGRTSPVVSLVQQALKHFRGAAAARVSDTQAVGAVRPPGADTHVGDDSDSMCGTLTELAVSVPGGSSQHVRRSLEGIAEQDAATSTLHSPAPAVQFEDAQCVDLAVKELQGELRQSQQQLQAEQQESTRLLQRLHSAQQHRLDAVALHAAAEEEFAAARLQRDVAEEQVLQLKQRVEQEHSACAELLQHVQAAQSFQRAAKAAALQLQEQHASMQRELLLAQQHEHELEQQLASTLQDLEVAAISADNPNSGAVDSSTACAAAQQPAAQKRSCRHSWPRPSKSNSSCRSCCQPSSVC